MQKTSIFWFVPHATTSPKLCLHKGIRTELALNIVSRNKTKCCYISTQKKLHILKEKAVKIEKTNSIVDVFEEDLQFTSNTNFIYLEIPTIVELIEEIVKQKDNCDYFVIDGLIFINEYTNPLFSSNKNYQSVLRHLKAVAELIEKPIVLLSALDDSIMKMKKNIIPITTIL